MPPNADGSATAAEITEAAASGTTWVQVRQFRGVTIGLGGPEYAFSPSDYVRIPRTAVEQLRIDRMIY